MNETVEVPIEHAAKPYRPSWIDKLAEWIDRRPASNWIYYLGFGLAMALIMLLILLIEGAPTTRATVFPLLYLAAAVSYMMGLIHYLNRRSQVVLANMRPVLGIDEPAYNEMAFRLAHLPGWTALAAGVAAVCFVLLTETIGDVYQLEGLENSPTSATALRIFYLICWTVFGTFLYHTIHQLRAINRVYTTYTRIDLFNARSLYGFSNLTALTAGSLAFISYGWMLVNPWIDQSDPIIFSIYIVLLLIVAVTFILPQLGIHRLLAYEKERLLDEVNLRFKATMAELHRRIDAGELESATELNTVLSSLRVESAAIKETPTWPWDPEVLRLLLTAIALPLGLWLVQLILRQTLGF